MTRKRTIPFRAVTAAAFGLCAVASAPALADNVVITYSAAGVYQMNPGQLCADTTTCLYGTENYSGENAQAINTVGGFVSTFTSGANNLGNGVSFTGNYSAIGGTTYGSGGAVMLTPTDQYGGSDGNPYPELFGPGRVANPDNAQENAYQVNLTSTGVPGIDYLGVWISALDPFNDLKVFNTSGQMIAQFNSPSLLAALGTCPTSAYCGNPTSEFAGQDPNELFAYINIFDSNADIGSIVLYDDGGTGFESDNLVVAYRTPNPPFGTSLPEPASLSVLGLGLVVLGAIVRRRAA